VIGFCLAAGSGSRLAPLTATVPKPLLAPAGRPLLDLACDALVKAGAERVVVNLHHGAEAIAAHLHGRPDVLALGEPTLLGTGGGLVAARRAGLLGPAGPGGGRDPGGPGGGGPAGDRPDGDPTVVVTCADHVVDPADLAMLATALERSGAPMAIGLDRGRLRPTFRLEGELAVADPDGEWTAAGVFALRPGVLDDAPAGYSTMADSLLEPCWRRGELIGVPLRGDSADAGTLGRFLAVSAGLLAGRWPYPLPPGTLQWDARGGPVFVAAGARLHPRAIVAGPLVLDGGASVGPSAVVTRSVLGPGARVGAGARVTGSLLGPGAEVAAGEVAVAALLPAGIG
jgi:mannose-1-phosphate guanylyltransferase